MGWYETSGLLGQMGQLADSRGRGIARKAGIEAEELRNQWANGADTLNKISEITANAIDREQQKKSIGRLLAGNGNTEDESSHPQLAFDIKNAQTQAEKRRLNNIGAGLAAQGKRLTGSESPEVQAGYLEAKKNSEQFGSIGNGVWHSNKLTGETQYIDFGDFGNGKKGGDGKSNKSIHYIKIPNPSEEIWLQKIIDENPQDFSYENGNFMTNARGKEFIDNHYKNINNQEANKKNIIDFRGLRNYTSSGIKVDPKIFGAMSSKR